MIDKKTLEDHNLTEKEFKMIKRLIGREPNLLELGMFSVMWSEHCSYKSSKVHLKKLPTKGKRVVQGPGENAGIIDIGDNLVAVFKIESHNHPSFIEPYQGAATGVGGILRDIFTMGARPIALLDSLRFGSLDNPKNRLIFEGVVSGIAGYGNSVGVPTVGGETYFDDNFSQNPLVNVLCLGIARKDKIFYARATGPGNPVIYVGATTGRDGIHGATMASEEFGKDSEEKRPNVQVGDPFKEKVLLEACLEVMEKELIVGIQDMGAAGITSSSTEMAGRAKSGIDIHLEHVPLREEGMTPYEIMLSESQERMLLIGKKEKTDKIIEIFKKWDIDAIKIGEVTDTGRVRIFLNEELLADLPVNALTEKAPRYRRPFKIVKTSEELNIKELPELNDLNDIYKKIISSPNIAHKGWIFTQYDHMVQTNTALLPGRDASVLRIRVTNKALALTLDGNPFYCAIDPKKGAMIAVAEGSRNLSCVGAKPVGATNCLNFGNPEKEEIMGQFKQAVEGIAEACRFLSIPITGGNVSFYNETIGFPVYPTPVLGILGLIQNVKNIMTPSFKNKGDLIILIGPENYELGGSEFLRVMKIGNKGETPSLNLVAEKKIQKFLLNLINKKIINSAHDVSEGGLVVCLSESSFYGNSGFEVNYDVKNGIRNEAILFGESQSRVVVSLNETKLNKFESMANEKKIPYRIIGRVGGDSLKFRVNGNEVLNIKLDEAKYLWMNSITEKMRHF
ncbi:MAG: phosphoribosylformylglycinamidine synthase subunit PurL [Acidobacteriota bacterium]